MRYQLCAVDRLTNRVTKLIGDPDTLERCQTFKSKFTGTYQPKSWYIVLPAEVTTIGYLVCDLT